LQPPSPLFVDKGGKIESSLAQKIAMFEGKSAAETSRFDNIPQAWILVVARVFGKRALLSENFFRNRTLSQACSHLRAMRLE
jgi:hypothetical protein